VKNVAFLTVIFPMKEEYLIDFFNSLTNQTFNKFDVIVINDGYKNFRDIQIKYEDLSIIELPFSDTPSKNREFGINYCIKKNYDILIFGDSDDYFTNNRIAKSIDLLTNHNIVVNDLTTFDETGILHNNYFSNRLKNNQIIDYNFIINKNILGLSNTAINLKILDKVLINRNEVAVDWFIFKNLLKLDYKAIFTNEIITYYRQHYNNTLGLKEEGGEFLFWWEKKTNQGLLSG